MQIKTEETRPPTKLLKITEIVRQKDSHVECDMEEECDL